MFNGVDMVSRGVGCREGVLSTNTETKDEEEDIEDDEHQVQVWIPVEGHHTHTDNLKKSRGHTGIMPTEQIGNLTKGKHTKHDTSEDLTNYQWLFNCFE
jgi:hypothetical protein